MAVVCADVMFNVGTPQIPDEALVSFSAKHNIKKMVNSDGTVRWYGCRRGLSYTKNKECDWPDGIGAPPCDLWNLGEAVKFIMQACDEGGFPCEYAAGNVLGKGRPFHTFCGVKVCFLFGGRGLEYSISILICLTPPPIIS